MQALGIQMTRTEVHHSGPLPQHFGDEFGWPEMVAAVADVYISMPREERAKTGILAGNYGEAGAIDFFGPRWTGKFDGKDYAVTGDPNTDTRSSQKVNDHTLAFTNKKGDKVTISGRGVVSADGKTRTVTFTGTDSKGKKYTTTAVYDKQ